MDSLWYRSEELNDVLKVLDRFEVDEVNCKDAKNLRSLTISIDQLCAQKEEVSHYSSIRDKFTCVRNTLVLNS